MSARLAVPIANSQSNRRAEKVGAGFSAARLGSASRLEAECAGFFGAKRQTLRRAVILFRPHAEREEYDSGLACARYVNCAGPCIIRRAG
jgi:hypothetical protein